MIRAMHRDKKSTAGSLRFVLPDRIGRVELVSGVAEKEVLAALEM
jgi:3-dehydroquinate synthase